MKELEVQETQESAVISSLAVEPIDMTEPRRKLLSFHRQTGHHPAVEALCMLLAQRLENKETLLPIGFVVCYSLLLDDLKDGRDGITGKRMNSSLAMQPPMLYNLLRAAYIPLIVKEIFEPHDAVVILNEIKEVEGS